MNRIEIVKAFKTLKEVCDRSKTCTSDCPLFTACSYGAVRLYMIHNPNLETFISEEDK
jgi:hypothetical protein